MAPARSSAMTRPDSSPSSDPSDHIEDTVSSVSDIHDEHMQRVGLVQSLANRMTDLIGRPAAVVVVVVFILLWLVANTIARSVHVTPLDTFPFAGLELFATIAAFLVTLLILSTQRHEQEADRRRDELTLHMAMLTEKKIAKVIALIEEQRSDNPLLETRCDEEADTMAQPTDPHDSIERIEDRGLAEAR